MSPSASLLRCVLGEIREGEERRMEGEGKRERERERAREGGRRVPVGDENLIPGIEHRRRDVRLGCWPLGAGSKICTL